MKQDYGILCLWLDEAGLWYTLSLACMSELISTNMLWAHSSCLLSLLHSISDYIISEAPDQVCSII